MAKNQADYLYVYMCLCETMFGIFGQTRGLYETIILIFYNDIMKLSTNFNSRKT